MAKKKKVSHAPRKKAQFSKAPRDRTQRRRSGVRQSKRVSTQHRKRVLDTRRAATKIYPLTLSQKGTLKSALQLVRKHIQGYEPGDGWRVRDLSQITPQRRATLLKKAGQLRTLLAQPYELVKAPTKKARHSLYQFTHQKLRKAKHFIVHKPGDNFDVRIRRGRVVVRGKFEGKLKGKRRSKVVTESAYFLFPRTARDQDDAERMLRDMLAEMPEGFYVMLTGQHGDTGEPVDKGSLVTRLRHYINAYQTDRIAILDSEGNTIERREVATGFTQAIQGFRFLSTSVDGMQLQMQARDARRARVAEYNRRRHLELMSEKERQEYEAPRKAEEKRQARRKAALKGVATRKAKARKVKTTRKHK